MYRGGDSVFRLSLIGIAFIFIFFLLIVFSRMHTDAEVARMEALTRLDQRQQEDILPLVQQTFESARQELQAQLQEEGVNADEVVRTLFDRAKAETENAALRQRVQELSTQLAGFAEVRKILAQAGRTSILEGSTADKLASALELRTRLEQELLSTTPTAPDQKPLQLTDGEIASRTLGTINFKRNIEALVERELGLPLVPGQEPAWTEWLVVDSQLFRANPALGGLVTSNVTAEGTRGAGTTTLRAQIAFLLARLQETHNDNIAPPCWFDDAGRVQFLLTIELRPGNVIAKSAWPPAREAAAQAIPGIKQLLRTHTSHTAFPERARAIARHGGQHCRYSVQVVDNMRSGMRSEKIHQELEQFFHLVHLPR